MWLAVLVFVSVANPEDIVVRRGQQLAATHSECVAALEAGKNNPPFPAQAAGFCIDLAQYLRAV